MNPNAMQEALRRKKAQALDLTIIVGDPEDPNSTVIKPLEGLGLDGGEAPGGLMANDGAEPGEGTQEEEKKDAKELNLAPEGTPLGEEDDASAAPNPMEETLSKNPFLGKTSMFQRNKAKK